MPSRTLRVTYIGGPTALLEIGGYRLLTDPTFDAGGGEYPSGPVTLRKLTGPALSVPELGRVDYVLLSHDHHADNLDRAGRDMLAQARKTLTTTEGASRLGGNSVGLSPWETIELSSEGKAVLRVVATPARHGPKGMERGAVIGFAVSTLDAPDKVVYIAGDTVWYEGVSEVAERFHPRVVLPNLGAARVPEVGPFHLTMTASEAVEASRVFGECSITPLHFEGWAHFSEGKAEISQAFAAANLSHRLRWPDAGRPIEIDL